MGRVRRITVNVFACLMQGFFPVFDEQDFPRRT